MRTSIVRAYALGIITGSFLSAGLMWIAAPARADVSSTTVDTYSAAVCDTLTLYPTLDGVLGIGLGLNEAGFTYGEAGEILVGAVIAECPQYVPLLKRFIARYGTANSKTVA